MSPINATRIPKCLTAAPQWVNWKLIEKDGRLTKIPVQPDGSTASHSDPATWGHFIVALDAYQEEKYPGVGFVLSDQDPYGGVDLDDCRDPETGAIDAWAWEIVQRIDSYTEVSPSGTGLRIFLEGRLPDWLPRGGSKRKGFGEDEAGALEVYCRLRYLSITGQHVEGCPLTIEPRQEAFTALCAEFFPEEKEQPQKATLIPVTSAPAAPLALDDQELLRRMFAASNGSTIERLWNGEVGLYRGKDGKPDHSAADLALCNHLAFWCNRDQARMDRLFRQSRLYRKKWDREDYRTWTLDEACATVGEGYTGPGEGFDTSDLLTDPEEEELEFAPEASGAAPHSLSFAQLVQRLKDESGDHGPSEEAVARAWARSVRQQWAFFEGVQWYRYLNGCWRYSSQERVEAVLQHWLVKLRNNGVQLSVTARKIAGVIRLARAYLGPHEITRFNSRPELIPLANGVYDLERDELLPHSPDNWLTHHFPVPYDPEATCPRWEQFLSEAMLTESGATCAEWVRDLQEWFGYCLIPDNRAQMSMVWVGEGQNGKGVATRLLEALLGSAQTLSVPVEHLHEPYHRADLHGKLVGFVNEPDPRAMVKNGAYFKAITGGDAISARRPTEKVFTFVPYCRLVISCNSIPATRDLSRGYFRRLRIIEWRYNVPEHKKDANLDAALRAELPGILNWALAGLRRFQKRNWTFEPSPESERVLSAYKLSEDTLALFVNEECELGDGFSIPTKDLYDAYVRWCREGGYAKPDTNAKFGTELNKRYGCPTTLAGPERARIRIRVGIRIREDSSYASPSDEFPRLFD